MKHAISIVGFEQEFCNQVQQLLLHHNLACSINAFSSIESTNSPGCKKTDIVVINGHDPVYTRWLRNCARLSADTPPASLVIGDRPTQLPAYPGERRNAPRIQLTPAELTGSRLVKAINELVETRSSDSSQTLADIQLPTDNLARPTPVHIGGYSIRRSLGSGGVGVVFQARTTSNQDVAIKLIDSESISDFRLLDRFIDEYELLSRIDHPHVIQVSEQGFTDTHLYIVMELLTGGTLKAKIQRGLSVEHVLQHAMHICHALATIHDIGILHRDIKSTNILFDENDQPVITDFGIAKLFRGRSDLELTMQGEAVGTPAYMSPEQVMGKEVTSKSDLYAFGVMLYEMLTGRLPFRASSPIAMMQKHLADQPPALPVELMDIEPVIRRLMEKQPDKRYPSAWDLYRELEAFLG